MSELASEGPQTNMALELPPHEKFISKAILYKGSVYIVYIAAITGNPLTGTFLVRLML